MLKLMAHRAQDLCWWLCVLHCSLSLWPLGTDGAKLRCGSELIEALEFVCGNRGIYLGKRGYGPRSRGRGIVDQCCLGSGCDLHHLEKYCAKAKGPSSTTQGATTEQQFQALLQRKLLQRLGATGSPQREAPESPQREEHRSSSLRLEHTSLSTHRRTKLRGSMGKLLVAPRSPAAA